MISWTDKILPQRCPKSFIPPQELLPLLRRVNRFEDKPKLKSRIDFEDAYLFTLDFFEAAFSRVPDVTTREILEQVVELHGLLPAARQMLEHVLDRAEQAERRPLTLEEEDKAPYGLLLFFDRKEALARKSRRKKRKKKNEPRLLFLLSFSARLYLEVPRKSDYFRIRHLLSERGIPITRFVSWVKLDDRAAEVLGGRITDSLDEFLEAHRITDPATEKEKLV